jgi:transcriptional regulator with XRE-family HTH domain
LSKIGEKIRMLRNELGLTQEQLGLKINLSKANISKYERSDLEPNLETLELLAEVFNVSVDFLLGRTTKRKSDGSITAYHIDADGLTEEEIEAVENMIEFYKQKHKK